MSTNFTTMISDHTTIGIGTSPQPLYTIENGYSWNYPSTIKNTLSVKGDAEIEGNLKVNGRDIGQLLEKIQDRLAVLTEPDPAKLEKYAALKKAYDHYKLMEKLIGEE